MQHIATHVDVDAPPAVVWDCLSDLASYPDWNPHVVSATGTLEEGSTLRIRVRRVGAADREMTVTVTDVDPERRLAWVGRLWSPWLFEGRHTFELEPLSGDRTRLHNREEVSGVLGRFVVTETPERDYEAMNRAVKERVERATVT